MKKVEYIAKYGEEAYERELERARKKEKSYRKKNPEKVKAKDQEKTRKGGKHYERTLRYQRTGLRGARSRIRSRHRTQWQRFKNIIAPDSQIHHEWIPQMAEYRGLALVEAKLHRYGIIDVIQILDGEITLLTEEEVRKKIVSSEM